MTPPGGEYHTARRAFEERLSLHNKKPVPVELEYYLQQVINYVKNKKNIFWLILTTIPTIWHNAGF